MDVTNEKVEVLNQNIAVTKKEADVKKEETQKLLDQVTVEEKEANIIKEKALDTEKRASVILAEALEVSKEATAAYNKAVPALENAKKAVENLKIEFINEFKSFAQPNPKALDVCIAVNWVTRPVKEKGKFDNWKYNVALMKEPPKFKAALTEVKDAIEEDTEAYEDRFKKVEEILENKKEHMTTDVMKNVSQAANAILEFVINIKDF